MENCRQMRTAFEGTITMKFNLRVDEKDYAVELMMGKQATIWVDDEIFQAEVITGNNGMKVCLNEKEFSVQVNHFGVSVSGHKHNVEVKNIRRGTPSFSHPSSADNPNVNSIIEKGIVYPPMPGRVITINVKEGDPVKVDTPILILEAMKMQNEIVSPVNGTVKEVRVSLDSLVEPKDVLAVIS